MDGRNARTGRLSVPVEKEPLDILATPRGILMVMSVLISATLGVGLYVNSIANKIELSQRELELHEGTNTILAFSNLERTQQAIWSALGDGALGDEEREDIRAMLDIVFVRAGHIERRIDQLWELRAEHGEANIDAELKEIGSTTAASLFRVVDVGDGAISLDARHLLDRNRDLMEAIQEAQDNLLVYHRELGATEGEAWQRQSTITYSLIRATWGYLVVIAIFGAGSLVLLSKEVVARRKRRDAEKRAQFLAYYDAMTGLPNRVSFQDNAAAILSAERPAAILLVDIDHFKEVNDRLGHAMGDAVLREVAHRMRTEAEANGGTVARLGGDEFAIIFQSDSPIFLDRFCRAILTECARPVSRSGDSVRPSISIGVATTTQVSETMAPTYQSVMRAADFALYKSKAEGRGCYTLFDNDLGVAYVRRSSMARDLPRAIANGDLQVFFQPKVDLKDGARIYGFEALARWERDGELVPPAEFVQIAEESGLIIELDRFILSRSIEILASWNRRYNTALTVSVNISALHLFQPGLFAFVENTLSSNDLCPELVTLEITETVELGNWEKVGSALDALRSIGCRIAIDDFGTGYSSLAYLRAVEADEIKIDRSLVEEIETSDEARLIVDSVIDLAHCLDFTVVVEGIERESQMSELVKLGCDHGQGYFFGRPLPAEEWLAEITYGKRPGIGGSVA